MSLKHRLTIAVYQELQASTEIHSDHKYSSIDDLFKAMWKNTSLTKGFALTTVGAEYIVMLLSLQHWSLSVKINTSADIIMLDRYMTSPYYLKNNKQKNLILFDEAVATQLILYNNDLKLFLQAHDSASDRPIAKR